MVRTLPGPRTRWGSVVAALVLVISAVVPAAPASAHGEDEDALAYVLIQQALGHLAHGGGHAAMDEALEKVGDALETDEDAGVDLALVRQAQTALEAEDIGQARTLLEQAIQVAVRDLPPATGLESGTKVVQPSLRGRGDPTGEDWAFGVGSLLLLLIGAGVAFRYRPRDTIRQLRISLTGAHAEGNGQ